MCLILSNRVRAAGSHEKAVHFSFYLDLLFDAMMRLTIEEMKDRGASISHTHNA